MIVPHRGSRAGGGGAGRGWSRFGFAIGILASIAANVAHSFIRPPGVVGRWSPPPGAITAAGFWPLALVISIEVISRVRWPGRWYWTLVRFGGLTTVAVIAAVISYRHLSGLLHAYDEDPLSATIGPLAVDGLMLVCSGALLAIAANQRHPTTTDLPVPVPDTGPGVAIPNNTVTATDSGSGVPARRRAGGGAARTDADLLTALAAVRRDPDGTVPVRRAAAELSTGPDRARRLLAAAGLLRTDQPEHRAARRPGPGNHPPPANPPPPKPGSDPASVGATQPKEVTPLDPPSH